jgi:hypothetical protein
MFSLDLSVKVMRGEDMMGKRKVIRDKGMEHFYIKMVENIQDIGKIIKCMVKVHCIMLIIKLLMKEIGFKIIYGDMEFFIIKIHKY